MSVLYNYNSDENLIDLLSNNNNRGFQNIGNTCYMNSTLQCLKFNLDLSNYFLKLKFKNDILKKSHSFLTLAYFNLLKQSWNNENIVVMDFFKKFQKVSLLLNRHQFLGFRQNDAGEFLLFLLDTIDESLSFKNLNISITKPNKIEYYNKYDNIQNEFYKYLKKYLEINGISIIKSLFTGFTVSQISNSVNNKKSNNFQPFLCLNLEIPDNCNNIYECFDHYCNIDELKEYKDKDYPENTIFKKQTKFINLPKYFVIILKRFLNTGNRLYKNEKLIKYPFNLNMNKYTHGYINNKNNEYTLESVIYHRGGLNGGHYFSICKNNNKWKIFNDSQVGNIMNLNQIINNKDAYVLFYKKI